MLKCFVDSRKNDMILKILTRVQSTEQTKDSTDSVPWNCGAVGVKRLLQCQGSEQLENILSTTEALYEVCMYNRTIFPT
jgi:hypothetical protein